MIFFKKNYLWTDPSACHASEGRANTIGYGLAGQAKLPQPAKIVKILIFKLSVPC